MDKYWMEFENLPIDTLPSTIVYALNDPENDYPHRYTNIGGAVYVQLYNGFWKRSDLDSFESIKSHPDVINLGTYKELYK